MLRPIWIYFQTGELLSLRLRVYLLEQRWHLRRYRVLQELLHVLLGFELHRQLRIVRRYNLHRWQRVLDAEGCHYHTVYSYLKGRFGIRLGQNSIAFDTSLWIRRDQYCANRWWNCASHFPKRQFLPRRWSHISEVRHSDYYRLSHYAGVRQLRRRPHLHIRRCDSHYCEV